MQFFVGTCGFPKSRRYIYNTLDAVELQDTFYNMPDPEKMAKLREEAPEFHFTAKVFQGITHPPNSPTFKRTRGFKPTDKHGVLKPTKENLELWQQFVDAIAPLRPEVLVVQTPPSLKPEPYIYDFFASIVGKWKIAWEPRGETYKDLALIQKIAELGVVIAVDPLKRDPIHGHFYYFRLHGLGKGEVNYRYKYSSEDLERLATIVRRLSGESVYIMFNNVYMYEDAVEFKRLLYQRQKI
ncbi:protein of unknown function DUF72 [Pyrobaculum islandicum DSM 4184]|uniref:DUF72 domain-containing protein n=1 Tax=Pyrobaculum islandicum (strain DSM 4184 / JCM 9189 / GEO3) TaxID=384616 RepID=A1RSZ9_PYRIL|nr:DUF72 domain-containing protein [Pyrobaculum islandicum]ABL88081.1 protein of unknown function DUF72 [Pyrobaculum islandicum DSM 4184]